METMGFYQAVVDALPSHVAVLDRRGTIVAVNRAWRVFAVENGLPPQLQWRGVSYLGACRRSHEDGASTICAGIEAVLDGSRLRFEQEYPCHAPDGPQRWFRLNVLPLCVDHEDYALVLHTNVTHRHIEVEQLGDERNRLEDEIRQLQKMEAVGRLAGGVAHDFNNLLMGISGTASVALRRCAPDEPVRFALDQIRNAAAAGTAITKQLLAFSRKRLGHATPQGLDAAILRNEGMLRHMLGEAIDLDVTVRCPECAVVCAEGELEQILMNLVVNARDAMPDGGRISVRTSRVSLAPDQARPGELPPGPYCVLVVQDEGRGMDATTRARIFEPFFTTKDQASGSGTGLGLSTVFGIVRRARGHIEVDSEPGRGSLFRLYLPYAPQPAQPPCPGDRGPYARGDGETVLVVEDDHLVRETVREYLRGAGYDVLEAGDGLTAQQIGRSLDHLDLVLTDMVLPGTTGAELAKQLTAMRPEARVVFMSAHPREVLLDARRLEPGDDLLHKPFGEHELLTRVREALPPRGPARRPGSRDAPAPSPAPRAPEGPAPAGRVVLLVEDDRMSREAVTDLLQDSGYVVHAAQGALEARRLVESGACRPEIIISDVMLPDGRGPEVVAGLDALGVEAHVVYLSGRSADEPEVLEALRRPRTRFLQKPVGLDVLLAELERA